MSDPPPPRGDNSPVAPLADVPAADPMDRAAAEAARMEAERLRIEAAINLFNVNYNQNGGPPQLPRLISPNRRVGNAPNLPPRVLGGGPAQGLAQGGGQALQPGLLQQLPRDNGRIADGGVGRLHANSNPDANTKESKFEIFTDLSEDLKNLAVYSPSQNETTFQKMRWAYTGQEPFEDYVHRMGSSARSLAVGDVCFKNCLYQSIKPPCTIFCIDMEPSAEAYIFMDKRQYAEAIND